MLSSVTHIRCPVCTGLMPPPFALIPVPVANTHVRPSDPHGPRCRVVVISSSTGAHQVHPVREGQTFEAKMTQILQGWNA